MGKTYRKNSWINKPKAFYVQDEATDDFVRQKRRGYKSVKKTKQEYEEEYRKEEKEFAPVLKEYENRLARWYADKATWVYHRGNDKFFHLYYGRMPQKPYFFVNKWKEVPLGKDEEEYAAFEEEASKKYDSYFRDRRWEGGCNKAFKDMCKKDRRISDRRNIDRCIKDPEAAENMVWADKKDGKKYIWSVW